MGNRNDVYILPYLYSDILNMVQAAIIKGHVIGGSRNWYLLLQIWEGGSVKLGCQHPGAGSGPASSLP